MKRYIKWNLKNNLLYDMNKFNFYLKNIIYKIKEKRIMKNMYKEDIYKYRFISYMEKNLYRYIMISLFFIIGLVLGTIYINYINQDEKTNIYNYTIDNINNMKEYKNETKNKIDDYDNSQNSIKINRKVLLNKSLTKKCILGLIIMILGSTIFGNVLIYSILVINGFIFGFTISTLIMTLGICKGILYILSGLLLQNILFIPILFLLSKIALDMYEFVIKNKNRMKDNIKSEIRIYIVKNFMGQIGLVVVSFIENFVSFNLLLEIIKFI